MIDLFPFVFNYLAPKVYAKSLTFLLALAVAVAYRPFEGVDPNTLSCDSEGEVFLLLPHFDDCNKFFMCAHGKEIEFKCAPGTYFDFELQACEWSWATTCQLREQDIEGSGSGSGDSELEWSAAEEAQIGILDILSAAADVKPVAPESRQFHAILDCESPLSAARHLPYKGDCQRFWRCNNGIPQATFCSDGLFFNAQTQQCDFEANSKCVDSQPNELAGEFIEYK